MENLDITYTVLVFMCGTALGVILFRLQEPLHSTVAIHTLTVITSLTYVLFVIMMGYYTIGIEALNQTWQKCVALSGALLMLVCYLSMERKFGKKKSAKD